MTIQNAKLVVDLASIVLALAAAYFWYKSAKAPLPGKFHGVALRPPLGVLPALGVDKPLAVIVDADPITQPLQEAAKLNRIAAGLSAGVAVAMAISIALGL